LGAGLRSLGWIEGRNLRVDYRFGGGDHDRIRAFAAEFASLAPDVLLGSGAPVTAHCSRRPVRSPSCSFRSRIRSGPAWCRAWGGRAET
jgi:hypothetical protein